MECCKRPPKMPSKTGVSRAEIAAHAFECSVGSGVSSDNSRPTTETLSGPLLVRVASLPKLEFSGEGIKRRPLVSPLGTGDAVVFVDVNDFPAGALGY